ncbi:site-specific integrase/recombinase [Salmonella enterica subsp. enterica]|uniref:Site-specific integrase/recombinase n=1 Tax=Salmonella enterica I TaxID=59201 RepID=A0A3S4LSB0_SALET|nr:site-specific integrase/recombinase [Salmonella enterica subsp. enterica]
MEQDLARIEQFLDALWLERNLAENTLSAYRRDLSMVVAWLHHRGKTLATAQADDLQTLLAERVEGRIQSDQFRTPVKRYAALLPASVP